ncbi:MAG: hypothetical protein ABSG98_12280 [Anaerolineales bacterium]
MSRTALLTLLPKSESTGVIGLDGNECPLPTQEQVAELFSHPGELVGAKVAQGFDGLELTPLATPISLLMEQLKAAIFKEATEGRMYQTRRSPSDPGIPVRISSEKQVWIWESLKRALDTDEPVHFPHEDSSHHRGQTKLEARNKPHICAVPGGSMGWVESLPNLPQPGRGKTLGGGRQLEIGSSPREFLQTLETQPYEGETGKTLENIIASFLTRLETTNERSHDRHDDSALWLLGHYVP